MASVPIERLKIEPSVRIDATPLDLKGQPQHVPIDILTDGTVIDGVRRIEAFKRLGRATIVARIWQSREQHRAFQDMQLEALLRDIDDDREW